MSLNLESLRIQIFDDGHDVSGFDCGEPSRNEWLRDRALRNQRQDNARTYVAITGGPVLAFYAITVSSVLRASVPSSMRRNAPTPIGCVLLAQLGVTIAAQGHGLGREMVLHAMRQAVRVADIAGSRLLATHPARPELNRFYGAFGFVVADAAPTLMVMPIQAVRDLLGGLAGG